MRSWRCSGFESSAIEASNRERRRHYFFGRAFWLKLPPGCAGAGNSGSMAGTHTNSQRQSVQWVGRRCCAAGYDGRASAFALLQRDKAARPYRLE